MDYYFFIKKFLFCLDAELSHHVAFKLMQFAYHLGLLKNNVIDHKAYRLMGLDFPNPVGLAAGLDKDGKYIDTLATFGFGFIEVGTVTPKAQIGNPKPRLFRIAKHNAIINKMGFNNKGVDNLIENLKKTKFKGILGINIGKNALTSIENAVDDYLYCLKKTYPYASYIVINISSPNTKKLRTLQQNDKLLQLLTSLKESQHELNKKYGKYVPIVVKIAPDLNKEEIKNIAQIFLKTKIDGVIATNTSIDKTPLGNIDDKLKEGGLSGAPLSNLSNFVLETLVLYLENKIPVIGCGGIMSQEDALKKINLGAKAVQIYSGFIYNGPKLIKNSIRFLENNRCY